MELGPLQNQLQNVLILGPRRLKKKTPRKKHQRQHTAGAHSTRDQPETFMLYLTQMFKSSMARRKQPHALTVFSMNLQGKRKGGNGANVNHDAVINNGGWLWRGAALTRQRKTKSQANIGKCKDCSPSTTLKISANNLGLFLKWCTAPGLVWSGLPLESYGSEPTCCARGHRVALPESVLEGLRKFNLLLHHPLFVLEVRWLLSTLKCFSVSLTSSLTLWLGEAQFQGSKISKQLFLCFSTLLSGFK